MRQTALPTRIVAALTAAPHVRMSYHDLIYRMWPPGEHPKAWRYSSNGGPPGCAMALGRALRELREKKAAVRRLGQGRSP